MMETAYGRCYREINVQTSIFIYSLPEHGLAEPRDSRHVAAARVIKFKDYITKVTLRLGMEIRRIFADFSNIFKGLFINKKYLFNFPFFLSYFQNSFFFLF